MAWHFRCYLDGRGMDVIDEWRNAQEEALQAKFDQRLRYLRQQPRSEWKRPQFALLTAKCAGLGEIRMEYKNVQHRVLGCNTGDMEYSWLAHAIEKGGKFVDHKTCETAIIRAQEAKKDRNKTHACDFE